MTKWMVLAMLALGSVACGGDDDDDGSGSGGDDDSTSTSTSKYSCSVNGTCYKCPSAEAVSSCGTSGPGDCTETDSSFCE